MKVMNIIGKFRQIANVDLYSLLVMPQERISLIGEEIPLFHSIFWLLSMEFKMLRDLIGPAKSTA